MNRYGRNLYPWIRDLHLYLGLFVSPFVLVFAVSTLLFNHTGMPSSAEPETHIKTVPVEIPEGLERIPQAQAIMRQVGVSGEIRNIFRRKDRLPQRPRRQER